MVRDEYSAYDSVIGAEPERLAAGCLAHARRKFDELLREGGRSAVAAEALQRIAHIYRVEPLGLTSKTCSNACLRN